MTDQIIKWIGDWCEGHFEVDGVELDVPRDASIEEVRKRLVGRSVVAINESNGEYELRLDDGQVLEICGIWRNDSSADAGIRFWGGKGQP